METKERNPDGQHNVVADFGCADIREELRERLMNDTVLHDYLHTQQKLFALGVH